MATVNVTTTIKVNNQFHILEYGKKVKVNRTLGVDFSECEIVYEGRTGIVNTKTLDLSSLELQDLKIPTGINGKPLLKGTQVRFVGPTTTNLKENDIYYVDQPYDSSRTECRCYKQLDSEYKGQVAIPHNKLEVL